jgi:AcrR family transcriptional regulator
MRYKAGLATRERILVAIRELLAEFGLDGTTVTAVCDRAEIGAGSFYNLFESKEQAVLAVVREAIDAVDPDPDGAGEDSVADLVSAYVKFITEEPQLSRVYIAIAVGGGLTDPEVASRVMRSHEVRVDRFRRALMRRRPDLSLDEATIRIEGLLAALVGLAVHHMLDPTFDFAGHALRLIPTD